MKLEVGQFIRTFYGIRKIVNITKDKSYGKPRVKVIELDDFINTGYKFDYRFYTDEWIIKESEASFNIIDLIEVGDYVEGIRVFYKDNDNKRIYMNFGGYCILACEEDIKSVVTHEQMVQMRYEIGERTQLIYGHGHEITIDKLS